MIFLWITQDCKALLWKVTFPNAANHLITICLNSSSHVSVHSNIFFILYAKTISSTQGNITEHTFSRLKGWSLNECSISMWPAVWWNTLRGKRNWTVDHLQGGWIDYLLLPLFDCVAFAVRQTAIPLMTSSLNVLICK